MPDQAEVHATVRTLALEVKEMTIGLTGDEPPPPHPVDLGGLDLFATVQLFLYLDEAFDVRLLERSGEFTGKTSADLADFVVEVCPHLRDRR